MFNVWKPWFVYRPAQLFRRIRYIVQPPRNGLVVRLPWGCNIKVIGSKTIGRSIVQTGIYDLATSELLWRLIRPGDQVLDIGANVGYMTALMGSRVGTQGKVLAFEPHPQLFQQLVENVELFRSSPDFGAVEAMEAAVSDHAGTIALVCPAEFSRNGGVARVAEAAPEHESTFSVQSVALDELLAGRGHFSVAKIDVEGHELHVLRGGRKTFQDCVTHVVFEEHGGPESPVCELLKALGFELLQFGWSMRRLLLAEPTGLPLARRYEAPNFLATRQPDEVLAQCRSNGWQVLQQR